MKVWIAVDNESPATMARVSIKKPVYRQFAVGDGGWWKLDGRVRSWWVDIQLLRKLGVVVSRGMCKQYDIPMFREVKRKAKR